MLNQQVVKLNNINFSVYRQNFLTSERSNGSLLTEMSTEIADKHWRNSVKFCRFHKLPLLAVKMPNYTHISSSIVLKEKTKYTFAHTVGIGV